MSKRRRPALRSLSGTRSASVPLASRQVRFQVRCESDPRSDFWTPMESIGLLGSETPETGDPDRSGQVPGATVASARLSFRSRIQLPTRELIGAESPLRGSPDSIDQCGRQVRQYRRV
jgi:hypothetical protein